jgi:SAM-dependent methyltransferase
LKQKTGLTPEQVNGKLILDAGVGAGRFADVLSRWGANVVGVDLSYAVEAAYQNLQDRPNVIIAQGDIGKLPFAPGTFDFIISIGVLHHTPDTKAYFKKLVPLLKPGGEICIWVYPAQGAYKKVAAWIPFTHRIPTLWYYKWCRCFVPFALKHLNNPFIQFIIHTFPISNQGLGLENDILDTFDSYSPKYYRIHTVKEVIAWFEDAGLVNIRNFAWDTSVRGKRPSF